MIFFHLGKAQMKNLTCPPMETISSENHSRILPSQKASAGVEMLAFSQMPWSTSSMAAGDFVTSFGSLISSRIEPCWLTQSRRMYLSQVVQARLMRISGTQTGQGEKKKPIARESTS